MVASNRRAVFYLGDYAEFSANDTDAYDACAKLSNTLKGGDITDPQAAVASVWAEFGGAASRRAALRAVDSLYLVSMAGSPPVDIAEDAALIRFLPGLTGKAARKKCAALFSKLPGVAPADWCPLTLLDAELMRNYYLQVAIEATARNGSAGAGGAGWAALPPLEPPGAIYIDAFDASGLIRTGAQKPGDPPPPGGNGTVGFAYADTLLYYNARVGCGASAAGGARASWSLTPRGASAAQCEALLSSLRARRAAHPARSWDDPATGRLASWPPLPGTA